VPAGDAAWLVELPERLDPVVNARAIDIASRVTGARLPFVLDVVVGYRSVMVYVDPMAKGAGTIAGRLRSIASERAGDTLARGASIEVPVCYSGVFGPDLPDIAAFARCDIAEVIERHLSVEYRVFVVGFVPGFAYMAPVDPRIAAPRRSSPRLKVPRGSVAIAAGQTGIYPAETPGGWNLIGRTPVRPYAPDRSDPFLFKPGDHVRFKRISEAEYRVATEWGDM
jgi:KipI family sensor histidine kinase inhibitor